MDLDWLKNGAPSADFPWHGPSEPATRKANVDPEQKIKQVWYLECALEATRSVGRVVLPNNTGFATCFLVAPNLILTNHHVFGTPDDAVGAVVEFGYRQLYNGDVTEPPQYSCDPSTFVTDKALDVTLIALSEALDVTPLRLRSSSNVGIGNHIAIIQHPDGAPLQVAMRDNSLVYQDGNIIQYLTNTDYGSSGSPVFNDNWHVIALHSKRVKDPDITDATVWYRNQGTRIEAILKNSQIAALMPSS